MSRSTHHDPAYATLLDLIVDTDSWVVHGDGQRVVDENGRTICTVARGAPPGLAEAIAQLPALLCYVLDGLGGPAGTVSNSHWARGDVFEYIEGITSSADYLARRLGLENATADPVLDSDADAAPSLAPGDQ